jgi:interferon gamma-inducible protein 30
VCLSAAAQGGGGLSKAKAQKCAANSKLAWATLDTCWTGAEGKALDVAAAAKTAALNPPHQFVPWVTLDAPGTFCTEAGCDDFIAQVCKAYTGTKPPACA